MKWYSQEINENHSYFIKGGVYDNSKEFYYLDSIELNKILDRLKDSKFVSKNFLDSLKFSIDVKGKNLNDKKQNDGPPYGFETNDFMFGIMENENLYQKMKLENDFFDNTSKTKVLIYKLEGNLKLKFNLIDENGHWLINGIEKLGD